MPRELCHTFVSLLSSDGMPLEDIADLVGHKGTTTTETVYRKVTVRPFLLVSPCAPVVPGCGSRISD